MDKAKKFKQSPLADNIVSRRIALGFRSAEAFAERADVPYPTLRDLEAGYSMGRPATIQKIAAALGCSMDELLQKPPTILWPNTVAPKPPSPAMRDIVSILSAFDERQLDQALAAITAIRNSGTRAALLKKSKRKA